MYLLFVYLFMYFLFRDSWLNSGLFFLCGRKSANGDKKNILAY